MHRKISMPRGWKHRVRSSVLHILALSYYTFTALLARAALSKNRQVRLRAQIGRRDNEIVLLQEELRIKDARMERVPPHRRPHYVPLERMAILELRASRGWSYGVLQKLQHLGQWLGHITLRSLHLNSQSCSRSAIRSRKKSQQITGQARSARIAGPVQPA